MIAHRRRGLALPAAVFTIAIVVLFIAGSAFAASQEARASIGTLTERVALETAEYGAAAVFRDWDPMWNASTPIGQTVGPFTYTASSGAAASVHLTRISLTTWWLVSDGNVGSAADRAARRTVNAVLRLDLPPAVADAALGVADSARVTGTGIVMGTDSAGTSGICATLTSTATAGVAAPDTTRVTGVAGIIGAPPLLADSTVAALVAGMDSALVADIVIPAGATVTPTPVIAAGRCDTLAVTNWGDPNGGVCGTHFPVIRVAGDVTVRGGVGQGILIAAGDVLFENGAAFAGIVIARDDFVTGNGGGSILGAVLAADVRRGSGDHTSVGSAGRIRRSSCRVHQARLAAAPPMRIRERWWMEFD